jgi:hypothetical protein
MLRDVGPNFRISENNTRIYSKHFLSTNFDSGYVTETRGLKPDAVPSGFKWTSNKPLRKPSTKREQLAPVDSLSYLWVKIAVIAQKL